jgi:hypothetical protein
MIIWLLALVLFVCLGYMGWCFGAIRVAGSVIGVILGALLAFPLGHIFAPIITATGEKNPVVVWLVGPFLAFLLVVIIFKIVGFAVHQKVDVYYKYKEGDLRQGLWLRLNQRLGVCLGIVNAAAYFILISWVIYAFSYWTVQVVSGGEAAWYVKLLNDAGKNLQSSGMAKVSAAIDPLPVDYYRAADIVGLIYHNDLLESRLTHYPAFLALGERGEFQDIGNDKDFTELRQRQPPFMDILNNSKAQNILNNPDELKEIWGIAKPDLVDLNSYLKTGQSATYDSEKILGRWDFNPNAALNVIKRTKTDITPQDLLRTKQYISLSFSKTTLVATPAPNRVAFLKDFGKIHPATKPNTAPTIDIQSFHGTWTGSDGKYQFSFPDKEQGGTLDAVVEGDRLTITGDVYPLVFDRE